jgi:hypothetical protein
VAGNERTEKQSPGEKSGVLVERCLRDRRSCVDLWMHNHLHGGGGGGGNCSAPQQDEYYLVLDWTLLAEPLEKRAERTEVVVTRLTLI